MRKIALLTALLMIVSFTTAAQQLPFVVVCMADDDKPLEVTFCDAVFAALAEHSGIREMTADDTSAVALAIIPNDKTDVAEGVLPASIVVAFIPAGFNGLSFYIAGGCDIVPESEINVMAKQFVDYAYYRATAWLAKLPGRMPDFEPAGMPDRIRLETSPP